MGESDFERQLREEREQWARYSEEEDRRRKAAAIRSDRFIRWFDWSLCTLIGLMVLVLDYTFAPTIINAVIKATHQWQALLR
jgi:hypothetical protein